MLSKSLCPDDLVLVSETIIGLRDKLTKWQKNFESNGLKVVVG